MKKRLNPEGDLAAALKSAIMRVLEDPKAEITERMRAIDAATRLLMVEHKIKGSNDKGDHFFK